MMGQTPTWWRKGQLSTLEEKQVCDYQKLHRLKHFTNKVYPDIPEGRNVFTRYPFLDILVQDNFTANLSSRQKKTLGSLFSVHF